MLQSILKSRWLWPGCGLLLVLCLLAMLFGPLWYEVHITRKTIAMIDEKKCGRACGYETDQFPPAWLPMSVVERFSTDSPTVFERVRTVRLLWDDRNRESDIQLICCNSRVSWLSWNCETNTDETLRRISRLRELTMLDFGCGTISPSGLSHFNSHPALKSLNMVFLTIRSMASDPEPELSCLTSLSLNFSSFVASPLMCFKNSVNLETLGINESPWHVKSSQPLMKLRALRYCRIGDSELTEAMLEDLARLPALQELVLSQCRFQPGQLDHLRGAPSLRHLTISQWEVNDSYVEKLSKLTRLEFLDVDSTSISTEGIRLLKKRLPGCTVNSHKAPIREGDELP